MDTDSNQVFKFTLANLKSKPVIISAVVIVVVAAVVGFWYWHNKKLVITSPAPTTPATTDKSIGSQVFEKANNPIGSFEFRRKVARNLALTVSPEHALGRRPDADN